MAQSRVPYSIPEENAARSAARLHEQYRTRLDADLRRQQRNRVIDVRPSRVAIEGESPAAETARQAAAREAASRAAGQQADADATAVARTARRARQAAAKPAADAAAPGPFAYEPRALVSGAVDLKPSPQERGVFVDLIV